MKVVGLKACSIYSTISGIISYTPLPSFHLLSPLKKKVVKQCTVEAARAKRKPLSSLLYCSWGTAPSQQQCIIGAILWTITNCSDNINIIPLFPGGAVLKLHPLNNMMARNITLIVP